MLKVFSLIRLSGTGARPFLARYLSTSDGKRFNVMAQRPKAFSQLEDYASGQKKVNAFNIDVISMVLSSNISVPVS